MLRTILLESGLSETIKWGSPCYMHGGKNILLLSTLKESVVIIFFRGAEMQDPEKVLEKPGDNSRFGRYLRVRDTQAIAALKNLIPDYIREAIEIENTGRKADADQDKPLEYPDELKQMFEENPDFKDAFSALTPGRRRGYLIHFSSARQAKTRTARIEKCMAKIFAGKGWNER